MGSISTTPHRKIVKASALYLMMYVCMDSHQRQLRPRRFTVIIMEHVNLMIGFPYLRNSHHILLAYIQVVPCKRNHLSHQVSITLNGENWVIAAELDRRCAGIYHLSRDSSALKGLDLNQIEERIRRYEEMSLPAVDKDDWFILERRKANPDFFLILIQYHHS